MEDQKKQGMVNLFVTYEIALLAKEYGFDEPCIGIYQRDFRGKEEIKLFRDMGHYELFSNFTIGRWTSFSPNSKRPIYSELKDVALMPLYQQLVDWFREKHDLHISLRSMAFGYYGNHDNTPDPKTWGEDKRWDGEPNKDYYEAFNQTLLEAFKLI